jgi:hypothetical protein
MFTQLFARCLAPEHIEQSLQVYAIYLSTKLSLESIKHSNTHPINNSFDPAAALPQIGTLLSVILIHLLSAEPWQCEGTF